MLKILGCCAVIGATSMIVGQDARAMPLEPAGQLGVESNVTQVRDGCGRGMRYSRSRDACVEQFDGGPRRGYHRGPPVQTEEEAAAEAAGAIINGLIGGGHREHHRRHRDDRW